MRMTNFIIGMLVGGAAVISGELAWFVVIDYLEAGKPEEDAGKPEEDAGEPEQHGPVEEPCAICCHQDCSTCPHDLLKRN